jgi:hypothetical protein
MIQMKGITEAEAKIYLNGKPMRSLVTVPQDRMLAPTNRRVATLEAKLMNIPKSPLGQVTEPSRYIHHLTEPNARETFGCSRSP